jgi:hypothetical protein
MLILVGVLAIVVGTLLISPGVRNTLWSLRTRVGRAGAPGTAYPPAFEERLMTVAIVIALVGVGLVVAGFVRAG